MKYIALVASIAVLAACSQGAADTDTTPPPPASDTAAPPAGAFTSVGSHANADLAGEWFGPEGTFVTVTPAGPGTYQLAIAGDLDAPAEGLQLVGRDAPEGIAFERNGESLILRRVTGNQTELTDLEGMTDCVMVQPGEGYCRRETGQ